MYYGNGAVLLSMVAECHIPYYYRGYILDVFAFM
jgi:hypothetical protein